MKFSIVLSGNLNKDSDELLKQIAILNVKNLLIIADNETIQFTKDIKNHTIINVDTDITINFSDLLNIMENIRSNSVNFFLFELLNNIISINSDNSLLHKLEEKIKTHEGPVLFLNPYLYDPDYHYINFIGAKNESKENKDCKLLMNCKEFAKIYFLQNPDINKILLGIKILTSSFFLSEFFDFYFLLNDAPESFEYVFPDNYFFDNVNDCIEFFKSSEVIIDHLDILVKKDSTIEAYEFLKDIFDFQERQINFSILLYKSGFFFNKVQVYSSEILTELNCNEYYLYVPKIQIKPAVERVVDIEADDKYEHYGTPYLYYMKAVLGFTVKSVKEKWLKSIYKSLFDTIQLEKPFELPFVVEKIYGYGTKAFLSEILKRMYFCAKDLYYDDLPMFIITSSYVESRAKTYCRKNNLSNFYKLDLIAKEISKVSVRQTKTKKKFLKVKY